MSRKVRLLSVLLVVVALLLAGCGAAQRGVEKVVDEAVEGAVSQVTESVTSAEDEPTPVKSGKGASSTQPTSAPAEDEEPEAEPEPEEEDEVDVEVIDPDEITEFDQLDSYRMTQLISWTSEDEDGTEQGTLEWEIAYVREPAAVHWRMSGTEGPDAEETFMEMIQIGGDTYANFGDEWMSMTSEDAVENPWAHSPSTYITKDAKRIGQDTVNGYECIHYRTEEAESLAGVGHIGQGEYWVSTEYDIVVRGIASWSLDSDEETGEWQVEWDVTEINEPISITAPEGVEKPGLPEDVPLMPGAANVSSFAGISSFEIDATAAEVTEFYMEALEDNGWTYESSMIETMHTFSKEGRSLTLMVDDESTPTTVTIMLGEQ